VQGSICGEQPPSNLSLASLVVENARRFIAAEGGKEAVSMEIELSQEEIKEIRECHPEGLLACYCDSGHEQGGTVCMYCFTLRRNQAGLALTKSGNSIERASSVLARAIDSWSSEDVDRVLGLTDQFLEDWAEDAVQSGQRDVAYEERSSEWSAMRPLLVAAPELLRGLKNIVCLCEGSSHPFAQTCGSLARTAMLNLHTRS
jgi:hypothetical protein